MQRGGRCGREWKTLPYNMIFGCAGPSPAVVMATKAKTAKATAAPAPDDNMSVVPTGTPRLAHLLWYTTRGRVGTISRAGHDFTGWAGGSVYNDIDNRGVMDKTARPLTRSIKSLRIGEVASCGMNWAAMSGVSPAGLCPTAGAHNSDPDNGGANDVRVYPTCQR